MSAGSWATGQAWDAGPGAVWPTELASTRTASAPQSFRCYDTTDRRGLAHGITLSRHDDANGGRWTLALPGGDGTTRLTVEDDPGADPADAYVVPNHVVELLRGITLDAPLVPVARFTTMRSRHRLDDDPDDAAAGGLEIIVDTVASAHPPLSVAEARRLRRCIAVEVVIPAPDARVPARIAHALDHAGFVRAALPHALGRAVDTSLPDAEDDSGRGAVVAYLREQLAAMAIADLSLRIDSTGSVHAMRVAARRIRSALQTFGSALDLTEVPPLIDELRELGRRLSHARDVEVQWARLSAVANSGAAWPDDPRADAHRTAALACIDEHFSALADAAAGLTRSTLDDDGYLDLRRRLDALTAAATTGPRRTGKVRSSVVQLTDKVDRHVGRATKHPDPHPERVHRARKSAKKLRYALEATTPLAGGRSGRGRFRDLQDDLGEYQDAVVAAEHLAAMSEQPGHTHSCPTGFALGALYAHQIARRDAVTAGIAPAWRTARRAARRLHT